VPKINIKFSRLKILLNNWQFFITACTAYVAIYDPIDVIFKIKHQPFFNFLDWFISIIFILDIFVSYYIAKHQNTDDILEEQYTLPYYKKRFFALDIIAAIPLVLFIPSMMLQSIRLVKMVKVVDFLYHIRLKEIRIANKLTLSYFIIGLLFAMHWLSCGWMALTDLDPKLSSLSNYIKAFYWCSITITSTGYGDISGSTDIQRLYCSFVAILGFGVLGFLIGNVASILSKKDPAKSQYIENIDKLTALITYRNLDIELQKRVRDFYTYLWKKRLGFDEGNFLEGLPRNLKKEVALSLKKHVVAQIPLFKDTGKDFIEEIAFNLKPVILLPDDYVFQAGDLGNEMYFIVKGECDVLSREGKLLVTLKDGDFFGEVALFMNEPRNASVKAITYCDLYTLEKKEFDTVMAKYPEIAHEIEEKAQKRRG
jgi:hypothetical protein